MTKDLPIIVITGPTASGKTKIATALAKKIDAEIISADSRAVYKGFDIVSAKPTKEEMNGIIHHLIDILEPDNDFSAGDFVTLASQKIEEIKAKNKRIIIVGGTWFYIKSLLDKKMLPPIPANPELRKELETFESKELWQRLYKIDKKRAEEINENNKEKIIRSIEMCDYLKSPISQYERQNNKNFNSIWYCPLIEKELLYENINKRVDIMMQQGLFKEFEKMTNLWGIDNKIINNTIGYQEFTEYEDINCAVDKIKQHTRNFAKRQLTYFKNNEGIKKLPLVELLSLRDI